MELQLHPIDIGIIILYIALTIGLEFWISHRASKNLDSYFLGGKTMPWYIRGVSNASGMFDITGAMRLVSICFMLKRTPKASATWYRQIIQQNGI